MKTVLVTALFATLTLLFVSCEGKKTAENKKEQTFRKISELSKDKSLTKKEKKEKAKASLKDLFKDKDFIKEHKRKKEEYLKKFEHDNLVKYNTKSVL